MLGTGNEPDLHHDYEVWLEKLAPHEPTAQYQHNGYEDNADAHMKRQVMSREVASPSQTENSTSARGNISSTTSSTAGGRRGYS